MLRNQTIEGLRDLRLGAMAQAYTHQAQDPGMNELSFDERLGLLVDFERTERKNRQRARLLRDARLKVAAAPEEVDYATVRGLDASVVRQLMTGAWIVDHHNLM